MYEGEKVPLDMPMVNEENKSFNFPMEFKLEKDINYDSWGVHEDKLCKGTFVKDLILSDHKRAIYVNHEGKQEVTLDQDDIRNLERLGVTLNEVIDKDKLNEYASNTNTPFFQELVPRMEGIVDKEAYKKFVDSLDDLLDDWYMEGFDKGDVLNFLNAIISYHEAGVYIYVYIYIYI